MTGLRATSGIEAAAVVLDLELDDGSGHPDPHGRVLGAAVADGVAQGLPGDLQELVGGIRAQPAVDVSGRVTTSRRGGK